MSDINEDLRKWFKQKWVNIGKKDKSGKHPECGTSGKKQGYAKCVPAGKAKGMSKKEKESATRRKRAAQNKADRGGTDSTRGGGKKPIRVSTKPKKRGKKTENRMDLFSLIPEEYKQVTEAQFDEAAGDKDACYHKVKARYDVWPSAYASGALVKCRKVGAANWGKSKKEQYNIDEAIDFHLNEDRPFYDSIYRMYSTNYFKLFNEARKLHTEGKLKNLNKYDEEMITTDIGKVGIYEGNKVLLDVPLELTEAEYQGKKVQLSKPKRGGSKKFYVYVKDGDKVKKVSFGADSGGGKLAVKLKDPKARKAFADRHDCENKKDKTKAGYWSCRLPRYAKALGLKGGGTWW